jgi:hypothetical protein
VRFGAEVSRGPVDIEDREESDAGGLRLVRRTVITLPVAGLPSVARSSVIMTTDDDGAEVEYKVRDIQSVEDGELRELICAEGTD